MGSWRWRSARIDRKSTRLNSSHMSRSYAVFCLKKKSQRSRRDRPSHLLANDLQNALGLGLGRHALDPRHDHVVQVAATIEEYADPRSRRNYRHMIGVENLAAKTCRQRRRPVGQVGAIEREELSARGPREHPQHPRQRLVLEELQRDLV